MKRTLLAVLLACISIAAFCQQASQINVPSALDCTKNVMPPNMPSTTTVAASGVGSVYTTTYTNGGPTWTQTVDTSVVNVTKVSCASHN